MTLTPSPWRLESCPAWGLQSLGHSEFGLTVVVCTDVAQDAQRETSVPALTCAGTDWTR
ncbi:hypothetical protein [Streptomyces bicolor]|uniref:hypothetical protein n=1 Tax=Streptomyces bicolor TaxID=66874 RepID=UPI000AD9D456|nr:hypothetical protein [Streptomyces bicolor]